MGLVTLIESTAGWTGGRARARLLGPQPTTAIITRAARFFLAVCQGLLICGRSVPG